MGSAPSALGVSDPASGFNRLITLAPAPIQNQCGINEALPNLGGLIYRASSRQLPELRLAGGLNSAKRLIYFN
jgi:hypothetical protein